MTTGATSQPTRIDPTQARRQTLGSGAFLVCAYDDDEMFRAKSIEGAIALSELEDLAPRLPRDRELIFYCA